MTTLTSSVLPEDIPYDIFLIVISNLIDEDIVTCLLTCKSWYQHSQHPSFWRDLILRHYPYDVEDATSEDYAFLRHLSFLSVAKPTLTIPARGKIRFQGRQLHAGTHTKIIKEVEDKVNHNHKVACDYLNFLIEKEKKAWMSGFPLVYYIVNPDFYKNLDNPIYLRFKNLPLPAYTAIGALLKIHHYRPCNLDGLDFLTELINRYYSKGLSMDALHRCVITDNVAPRSHFNNRAFFIMQKP